MLCAGRQTVSNSQDDRKGAGWRISRTEDPRRAFVPWRNRRRLCPSRLSRPSDGGRRRKSGLHARPRSCAKILIVDDEPINVEVVREYLASVGYTRFTTLSDAREVLPFIAEDEPDLVLLDIMMPHVNGIEILRQMRSDPRMAFIPVLILTAAEEEELNALELGATDVLGKPVAPASLIARVRNALVIKAHHDHLVGYAEELEREVRRRTAKLRRQTVALRRRGAELDASRLELIHCLARAAEYRDNETGRHVVRVGKYAGIIARTESGARTGSTDRTCGAVARCG